MNQRERAGRGIACQRRRVEPVHGGAGAKRAQHRDDCDEVRAHGSLAVATLPCRSGSARRSPMLTRTQKPWPQNAWYQAAWSHELPADMQAAKPVARTILNEPVVLFRDAQGKASALVDRCCHRCT